MTEPSETVHHLTDRRRKPNTLYFTRAELGQLLSLYSGGVMNGEWRDYALDNDCGRAMFSIYRHTHESPVFTIVKCASDADRTSEYQILAGKRCLQTGKSLMELLEVFQRRQALASMTF